MHITLITLGSRGDVQPYATLAIGLRRAGHQVRLATQEEFRPLIAGHDIELKCIRGNPREFMESAVGHDMLGSGGNSIKFLYHFNKMLAPFFAEIVANFYDACRDTDAVVFSNSGIIAGLPQIAESFGIKYCTALLQPFTPTRAYPSAFFPELPSWWSYGRGTYNRMSHRMFMGILSHFFGGITRIVRHDLGLSRSRRARKQSIIRSSTVPILYGYSPSVIPPPADMPANHHVTGFWFMDEQHDWQPSPELMAFLEAGPPPVYIGYGSMSDRDPETMAQIAIDALKRTGQRGILVSGWGGLQSTDIPESMFLLDSAPHAWLFPRMSAVVHHGGAGTTAAGLRAGVPTIVVPFFADQPYWGRIVYKNNAGPRPIPRKMLSTDALATAIQEAVTNQAMRTHAAELGTRIQAEDGVGRAVEIITEHCTRG